jgi:hypothetical protein
MPCELPQGDDVSDQVWIARLTPTVGSSVETLLAVPIGLDVWERHADFLLVAATESQLAELERRRLAHVERWSSREQFTARTRRTTAGPNDHEATGSR